MLSGVSIGAVSALKGLLGRKEDRLLQSARVETRDLVYLDEKNGLMRVSRTEYLRSVLPALFDRASADPERLHRLITECRRAGFLRECLVPSTRLYQIDSNHERATVVLGTALIENDLPQEAERIFDAYLAEWGASGAVLTQLATVHAARGFITECEETLWKALTADPNYDEALRWWGAIHMEKGGEDAFLRSVEMAAALPGSWRPHLLLAKSQLEKGNIGRAMAVYRTVLERRNNNTSPAVKLISGDLRENGFMSEMVKLLLPIYDIHAHGPEAGWNLAQACVQSGYKKTAGLLLDSLDRLRRPELRPQVERLRSLVEQM
ncbi:MAG TPA: hypothetical protein VJX67_08550 [Blastocatellia bacterium]|nr:hypothetical protein [Blastocatellia bacterium]